MVMMIRIIMIMLIKIMLVIIKYMTKAKGRIKKPITIMIFTMIKILMDVITNLMITTITTIVMM